MVSSPHGAGGVVVRTLLELMDTVCLLFLCSPSILFFHSVIIPISSSPSPLNIKYGNCTNSSIHPPIRLDALEAAEQAHTDFLRSIAQKEAPDPIGLMATATASAGAHHPHPPPPNGMADPVAAAVASQPHLQPRFWNQRHAAGEAAAAAVEGESGSP